MENVINELDKFIEKENDFVSEEHEAWYRSAEVLEDPMHYHSYIFDEDTGDFIEECEEDYEEDFSEYNDHIMTYIGMKD